MRNIRHVDRPVLHRAVNALDTFNSAHPWSHNDHFHGWIETNLPARRRRAVDIGCGHGELLARLAPHFEAVVGTDLDAEMRRQSRTRCAPLGNVTVEATDLHDLRGTYDLITMVAVLHHLEIRPALERVRELLAPGGRLLVVGLAPPVSALDHGWDLASAVANPMMGLVKHARRASSEPLDRTPFPARDPTLPFEQVRTVARRVLPGAVARRRLFFRHTIAWTAPASPA